MEKEPGRAGPDEDPEGFEAHRHREDRDLPVEDPVPDGGLSDADEVQEDERREAPDVFLAAEVAHDPAAHPVEYSERKREELSLQDSGSPHHEPDGGSGERTGEKSDQHRARER